MLPERACVTVGRVPISPVPHEALTELDRVVERWRQLPLDRALPYAGRVRALVQRLADGVAAANGFVPAAVPKCGPATLMDQLTVLVYDACVAELSSTAGTSKPAASTAGTSTLAADLATLRRELR